MKRLGMLSLLLVVALWVFASCSATGDHASTSTPTISAPGGAGGAGGQVSFTATGTGGSSPDLCALCAVAGGQCSGGVCSLSDNPGNVDATTQTKLQAGGSADTAFAWLYPYDKTVFPRGLTPPTFQFAGATPQAFYVHVSFPGMDYKGFYASNIVQGFALSAADWTAITQAAGPTTPVRVDVTKIAGGQVSGPITETWTIAQGSLRGTIYYETYGSPILGGDESVGIMKIQPGAAAPTPVKSGCGNVCHTASADGSTLVASVSIAMMDVENASASYDLHANASTLYGASGTDGQIFTYGGLYPDGSFVVSATGYRAFTPGASPGLYDTHSGGKISAPGFDGVVPVTGTPAFSPDGTMLALNASGEAASGGGSILSVMSFDHATFTFSNKLDVANHLGLTVAWPAFTPDGKWVVYHAGSNPQFETDKGATGDLYITSSISPAQTRLDALDGYAKGGHVYLPANDADLSFAPTVLPEAVGGYFWVVFTSHRSYGNTLLSMAGNATNGPDTLGKLWVAALDIDASPGVDPSHPAFYLDGQEQVADNLRGFWVLDPCQQDGASCASGDECCGGFCLPGAGGGARCASAGGGCSNLYESCAKASDCCETDALCINGKCALPPPK